MPNFPNRSLRDFSRYDEMDDHQLQEILREDASKPEGEESDIELLLYVMEVLAKRRNARNEAKDPEAALASFRKNYNTNDELTLISDTAVKKRSRYDWRKGLTAAAAVLALVIGCSITAGALGCDIWTPIARWTKETFHFGYAGQVDKSSGPSAEDAPLYSGLQEALEQHNVHSSLQPTWLPDGYVEGAVKVSETPKQRQFAAIYKCGDNSIKIWIADYIDFRPTQIEQSDSALEVYESAGIQYFIFSDKGQIRAAWIRDNFECYISGPVSIMEMKQIIDSIGKG